KCQRCLQQDEEEEDFERTLKRIAEDEKLAPVPKSTARDRNAPKLYFKRCIKWKSDRQLIKVSTSQDLSHSRPSDIEREAQDPEYIPIDGFGQCYNCAKATPRIIEKMKQNGDYDKDDPWGALTEGDNAEGASKSGDGHTLEEIAGGFTNAEKKAAQRSPSADKASPERPRSRSSSPETDFGPSKGKGRSGERERARPETDDDSESEDGDEDGAVHSDESEDDTPRPRGRRPLPTHDSDDDDDDESDDGSSTSSSPAPKRRAASPPDWSNAHGAHGLPARADKSETGHEQGQGVVSPEELASIGLNRGMKLTRAQFESVKARKQREAQQSSTGVED
ncbi:MAG: hypothetical protein Q9214_007677, partial [Letrouitia sp. 1 TL-2023]